MRRWAPLGAAWRWISDRLGGTQVELSHFEQVLQVERDAINERRKRISEQPGRDDDKTGPRPNRTMLPEVKAPSPQSAEKPESPSSRSSGPPGPDNVIADRPRPQPCDAVGIALSGGGIRSAAFSLGALQALETNHVLDSTDYLSTVSGGGYTGTSLSASMSVSGGLFPFGGAGDVRDNDVIGHMRNYSNYLIPRAFSGLRNGLDAAAILLRGLCANAVMVVTFLSMAALLTWWVYPSVDALNRGASFLPLLFQKTVVAPLVWFGSLLSGLNDLLASNGLIYSKLVHGLSSVTSFLGLDRAAAWLWSAIGFDGWSHYFADLFAHPFGFTRFLAGLLAALLVVWAIRRSVSVQAFVARKLTATFNWARRFPQAAKVIDDQPVVKWISRWAMRKTARGPDGNDVNSPSLRTARWILGLMLLSTFLDLLPLLVRWLGEVYDPKYIIPFGPASILSVVLALSASRLGAFLDTTKLSARTTVRLLRVLTQIALVIGALILPLVLFLIYLHFTGWIIQVPAIRSPFPIETTMFGAVDARQAFCWTLVVFAPIVLLFEANAYSLHQFYKDRLSKAFLFNPIASGTTGEPMPLVNFKLSQLVTDFAPYHIVNAALNVQGSREANRRGRNADFFIFTRDFIGSDLTLFARTRADDMVRTPVMEGVDTRLDLGSAMAISGAALSANMGSHTVRLLSPTLALLNIRLGYWLRNPRHLASLRWKAIRPLQDFIYHVLGKFFLIVEMFNFLHENSPFVYLSDGGHIENLGIYELLKRGCKLIIAIDAEADPDISCSSLLKLERYARIDLGVRIILPWEEIALRNRETNKAVDPATPEEAERHRGPHCAVGRILYDDGTQGVLLYFKSSLSGDEKDYVLDYKKRYRDFPHETTGDQFFTEEQFEVYRALGYHVVEGYFSGDEFAVQSRGQGAWDSAAAAQQEIRQTLGYADAAMPPWPR